MSPPVAAPSGLDEIAARVEAHLESLLAAEEEVWAAEDPALAEPVVALRTLVLGGGKRLRPAFCHWGFVAGGGDPDTSSDAVVLTGAAFELLHAFALAHDDVMDGSDARRGHPTTHVAFAQRHRGEGWNGPATRFGEGVAILVGDLAHTYAERVVAGLHSAARRVWHDLQVELMMGQYLDLRGTATGGVDLARARRIAILKSGRYTIERPLEVGASLAGAGAGARETLRCYGAPLGEAFQMRDDVLGAFGSVTAIGKPVGDDLREGKPTPLLALARAAASPPQQLILDQVGDPDLSDDTVAEIRAVITETGALDALEDTIAQLTSEATSAVEAAADLDERAIGPLVELAHFVATRDQ